MRVLLRCLLEHTQRSEGSRPIPCCDRAPPRIRGRCNGRIRTRSGPGAGERRPVAADGMPHPSQASPHSAIPLAGLVDKSGRQAASWWTSGLCGPLRTSILNLARRGRHSQSSRTREQSPERYRETGPTTARPPATDPATDRRSRAIAVAGAPVGRQPVPLGASLPAADLRTHPRRRWDGGPAAAAGASREGRRRENGPTPF